MRAKANGPVPPLFIVHTEASCGWGGQELRILSEAAGLMARGHRVALLCPREARIHDQAPRFGVPVEALPLARKRPRGVAALRQWLARERPDVVNTHSSTDAWLAALACKTLAAAPPIVRTRHISAPIPDNAATRWLYTRATAKIVTTGEALRASLIGHNRFPAARIVSVPTGIDPQRFAPGDRAAARARLGLADAHYIGIVATLRSWKGHLYLLEAFAGLSRPGWRLAVVGDGPMREVLAARAGELGLGERVVFAGQRDDPETWLTALDIFCLPSYANEGVPQALVQAMFGERAIVTTPVGSILDAVADGESALVVPPRDAGALAAALRRLADDPALRVRLATAARERALARFSREAMLDRMEAIFLEVARPRAARGEGSGR